MSKFYTNDPEDCLEIYDTAEQAQEAARNILEAYRRAASTDGWHEDQEAVCWGELRQIEHAQIVSHRLGIPENGEEFGAEYLEYDMRPTINGESNG